MNKIILIAATMSMVTGLFVSPVLFGVGIYMIAKPLIALGDR